MRICLFLTLLSLWSGLLGSQDNEANPYQLDPLFLEALDNYYDGQPELAWQQFKSGLKLNLHNPLMGRLFFEEWEYVASTLEQLLKFQDELQGFEDGAHPEFLQAAIRWRLLERARVRRLADEAERLKKALGIIDQFQILGPLDNERGAGFHLDLPFSWDDDFYNVSKTYPGRLHSVAFRQLPSLRLDGLLNLDPLLSPSRHVSALLLTHIHVPEDTEALVNLASPGFTRLWVGQQEIHAREGPRYTGFDQDRIPVMLKAGWNRLTIMCGTQDYRFRVLVRLTDTAGHALKSLTLSPDVPSQACHPGVASSKANQSRPSPRFHLENKKKKTVLSRDEYLILGLLQEADYSDDRRHEKPATTYRQALEHFPEDRHLWHGLGRSSGNIYTLSIDTDLNERRQAFENILKAWPSDLIARLGLVRLYSDGLHLQDQAKSQLALARELYPLHREVLLEDNHLLETQVFKEKNFQRLPDDDPALISHQLDQAQQDLKYGQGFNEIENQLARLVQHHGWNPDRVSLHSALLKQQSQIEAYRNFVHKELAMMGDQDYLRQGLIEHYRDHKMFVQATEEIEKWKTLNPDLSAIWRLQGECEAEQGRRDQAKRSFQKALELDPNNPTIHQWLVFFESSQTSDHPFQLDLTTLIAAQQDSDIPNDHPWSIVLSQRVLDIHDDGTYTEWEHELAQVHNQRGLKAWQSLDFRVEDTRTQVRWVKVHHSDRQVSDFTSSVRHAQVQLSDLQVGDLVESMIRRDLKQPSFFGDYFGTVHYFARKVPVADSRLIVQSAQPLQFESRGQGFSKTTSQESKALRWQLKDIPPLSTEPLAPSGREQSPQVAMTSWQNWEAFNTWYRQLIDKQGRVTPELESLTQEVTAKHESIEDQIRAIYDFVRQDIRYEAWEFGVHGFKPYTSNQIIQRRFGDCKDKSQLINSMLSVIGVDGDPVLIRAVEESRDYENLKLPMLSHFNHMITRVTMPSGDHIYLDGTAKDHPFGTLPAMDAGAQVLVITPEGPVKDSIPWNKAPNLGSYAHFEVHLDETLQAQIKGRVTFKGDKAYGLKDYFLDDQKSRLILHNIYSEMFGPLWVDSKSIHVEEPDGATLAIDFELTVTEFLKENGANWRLPAFEDFYFDFEALVEAVSLKQRQQVLALKNPEESQITVILHLPPSLEWVDLPSPLKLHHPALSFEYKTTQKSPQEAVVSWDIVVKKNRVPVSQYQDFRVVVHQIKRQLDKALQVQKVQP